MNRATPIRILAALFASLAVFHAVYFALDGRPLLDHDDYYLQQFARDFDRGVAHNAWICVSGAEKYPAVNALLIAAYKILPSGEYLFVLGMLVFYLLLVAGAFFLARELGGTDAGLVAALVVACLPIVDNLSRKYFLQHFAVCVLIWAHWLVVRIWTQGLTRRRLVAFSLVVWVGNLVHPVAYLIGLPLFAPLWVYALLHAENAAQRRGWWREIAYAFVLTLGASLVFSRNLSDYFQPQRKLLTLLVDGLAPTTFWGHAFELVVSFWWFYGASLTLLLLPLAVLTWRAVRRADQRSAFAVLALACGWHFALAAYFSFNGLSLIGFTMGYVLLPVLMCAALGDHVRTAGPPAKWRKGLAFGLAAGVCVAALVAKAAVFWQPSYLDFPLFTSADDRRLLVFEREFGGRIADRLAAIAGDGPVSLKVYQLEPISEGPPTKRLSDHVHAFSALRLAAARLGVALSAHAERFPDNPDTQLVYFAQPEPLDDALPLLAGWLRETLASPRTRSLTWWTTTRRDGATTLTQEPRYVFAALREVAPAPLSVADFLDPHNDAPAAYVSAFLAQRDRETLEDLARRATAAGRFDKARLIYEDLVTRDPSDPALLLSLAEADLRAGYVEYAQSAWRGYAAADADFGALTADFQNLDDLPIDEEIKSRFVAPFAGLTLEEFADASADADPTRAIVFLQGQRLSDVRELALAAVEPSRSAAAERACRFVLAFNPDDHEMRRQLAILRTRRGDADINAIWDDVFAAADSLPPQLDALRALASLPAEGLAVAETFETHRKRLLAEHYAEPQNVYLLRSLRVLAAKARQDWPAALAGLAELRRGLRREQIPGVDLEEATVRWRANQPDAALRLVEKNLRTLADDNPVRADSAVLATEIYAATDRPDAARRVLIATAATADANSVAYAAAKVAQRLADPTRADAFLADIAARLTGNGHGLVLVERAKLALAQGNRAGARELFVSTQGLLDDPALAAWVAQSIQDIDEN